MKRVYLCFCLAVIALFLGWLPKLNADRVAWFLDNDFAHFYLTGKLVRSGVNPYGVALSSLYSEEGFTPSRDIPFAGTPPALAGVLAPFTILGPKESFVLWTAVQVVSLMLGALMVSRLAGLKRSALYTGAVLLGAVAPLGMFAHIRYGQAQALIFFLVVLGLGLMEREGGWSRRLGLVVWGFSAGLKLFTLPLVFVAWRYRGRVGVGWFALGFALPLLALAMWCGVSSLTTFVTATIPYIRDLSLEFNGNISLSGALTYSQRILFGEEVVSARVEQFASLLLFLPLVIFERREKRDLIAATLLFLTASCLLSPTSWPHYLPLLTGGFIYILSRAEDAARPTPALWVTLGLYVSMGAALGFIGRGDALTRLVSAWWGPMCMAIMGLLVTLARRRSWLFATS